MFNFVVIDPQVHYVVVQFEAEDGYRFWTKPVPEADAQAVIAQHKALGYTVDDYDSAAACECADCHERRAEFNRMLRRA